MNSHCSAGPEAESLEVKSLGGKPSATLSGKIIAKKLSRKESKMESSTTPQYSAISEHSSVKGTPEDIEAWLKLSLEDFRVNHFQSQESEKPQTTPEICGNQRWKLSRQSSRPLCSLRTYQDCFQQQWTTEQGDLFTTLELFSETWPKAGTMLNGVCWEQMMSERHTTENDCGYSEFIPTPNTMDHLPVRSEEAMERQFSTSRKGRTAPGNLREWIHPNMWPTPKASDPNQSVTEKEIKSKKKRGYGLSLPQAVKATMFPTPTAADNRDRGGPSTPAIARRKEKGKSIELSMTVDGALNPMWVEWLMGWPIGHTDLKPSEMDKFQSQWLQPMQSYLMSLLEN